MNTKEEEKEKQRLSLIIRREIIFFKRRGGKIIELEAQRIVPSLIARDHLAVIAGRDDFEIETIFGFDPVSFINE